MRELSVARLIASGTVKTLEDVPMDDPQPSSVGPTEKVQRLDGGGFESAVCLLTGDIPRETLRLKVKSAC